MDLLPVFKPFMIVISFEVLVCKVAVFLSEVSLKMRWLLFVAEGAVQHDPGLLRPTEDLREVLRTLGRGENQSQLLQPLALDQF